MKWVMCCFRPSVIPVPALCAPRWMDASCGCLASCQTRRTRSASGWPVRGPRHSATGVTISRTSTTSGHSTQKLGGVQPRHNLVPCVQPTPWLCNRLTQCPPMSTHQVCSPACDRRSGSGSRSCAKGRSDHRRFAHSSTRCNSRTSSYSSSLRSAHAGAFRSGVTSVNASTIERHIRISVDTRTSHNALIATMAHELQHALRLFVASVILASS